VINDMNSLRYHVHLLTNICTIYENVSDIVQDVQYSLYSKFRNLTLGVTKKKSKQGHRYNIYQSCHKFIIPISEHRSRNKKKNLVMNSSICVSNLGSKFDLLAMLTQICLFVSRATNKIWIRNFGISRSISKSERHS
jgi:hypothetical protein